MSGNSSKNSSAARGTRSLRVPLLKGAKSLGISLWIVASFFGGSIIAGGLLVLLIRLGMPYEGLSTTLRVTVGTTLSFVCSLLFAYYVPKQIIKKAPSPQQMGTTRWIEWQDIGLGVAGLVPYFLLAGVFVSIVGLFMPLDLAQKQDIGFSILSTSTEVMMAFITLVVVAPIVEELLFRGYFYGALRSFMGVFGSSLVVSMVFGILHGQWNVGVNVFALSLVMCLLREYTGSVWAGIVLHMTKNALAFYMLFVHVL